MSNSTIESQIFSWIDISLQHEDIENYVVRLSGSSDKSEGYTTDIIFVNVKGLSKSEMQETEIYLILKISKSFENCKRMRLPEFYDREMLMYNCIFPEFAKFERSRNLEEMFNSFPKCYQTLTTDGKHIIILENLRKQGFEEYNRLSPMNVQHIKMVLKNYAKFHAISFAFRQQNSTKFQKLVENYTDVFYNFFFEGLLTSVYQPKISMAKDLVKEANKDLASKIEKLLKKGIVNTVTEVFQDVPENEIVIRHGDCWNSNFLFKYEVSKV